MPPFLFFLLRRSLLLELRLSLFRLSLLRLSLLRASLGRPLLLRLSLLRLLLLLGRLLARSPPCWLPSDLRVGSEICT